MKRSAQMISACLALFAAQAAFAKPEFLNSDAALKTGLPFSEAVKVDGMLYLSGQLGLEPTAGKLVEGGIEAESRQTMDNIDAVLKTNGYAMQDIVKCTVFLTDMGEWSRFNTVYKTRFEAGKYPARSAIGVSALAAGAKVEVECMAAK
jgi:reactive intermediate/imine deaminase